MCARYLGHLTSHTYRHNYPHLITLQLVRTYIHLQWSWKAILYSAICTCMCMYIHVVWQIEEADPPAVVGFSLCFVVPSLPHLHLLPLLWHDCIYNSTLYICSIFVQMHMHVQYSSGGRTGRKSQLSRTYLHIFVHQVNSPFNPLLRAQATYTHPPALWIALALLARVRWGEIIVIP